MQLELGRTSDGRGIPLLLRFANRHGLVTGATGTGKTVTLQTLAEGFSKAGVPVFAADVKGDLSGLAAAGKGPALPVRFWDVLRKHGLPVQTSVDRVGQLLLARMLNLNQVQEGTLAIAFKRTADEQSALFSLDDLRWQIVDMTDERAEVCQQYGNVTGASLATIQREILTLEAQGAADLFGEPQLDIRDFMALAEDGRGMINLLHADGLMEAPRLYAGTLLWLLYELFRVLPEAGDLDKPKLVLFFDEAHLLFRDAPPKLLETIERMVRLVRSKGVGVFFVTQSPIDVPDRVLAQLGNRIQHALRAYTLREQKLLKAAAKAFRPNPAIKIEEVMTTLAVGEALVSTMIADGVPMPVERIRVRMPESQIGPISEEERAVIIERDPMRAKYQVSMTYRQQSHAFMQRMAKERGWPEVPDYREDGYQDGDWVKFVPDFSEPEPVVRKGIHPAIIIFGFGAFCSLLSILVDLFR